MDPESRELRGVLFPDVSQTDRGLLFPLLDRRLWGGIGPYSSDLTTALREDVETSLTVGDVKDTPTCWRNIVAICLAPS